MDITYIYVLKCPVTFEIRYVGKANNPKRRYYSHMNLTKTSSSHKKNWIKQLKDANLRPILEVVAEVPISNWQEYEKYYIKYYKELGCNLTNLGVGGEGLGFGNQTSFKKGVVSYKKERLKKECIICGTLFEVSPSNFNRNNTCSKTCAAIYRKDLRNSGNFKKGSIPWNKNITNYTHTGKFVNQLDLNTGDILNTFSSMCEAERSLGLCRGSVSNVVNKRSKSAGGYMWNILENKGKGS